MKKCFLMMILSMVGVHLSQAQSFMRYRMNDGSYNGFYTDCVDSIKHTVENDRVVSRIYVANKCHTIPVECVEEIAFENALVSDGNAGDYRICELEDENGEFKKIYVDSRAVLFASKTGEFGANDTILMASVYNDIQALFFTDDEGRISRYFDKKTYLIFDYKENDTVDIVDFSEPGNVSITNVMSEIRTRSAATQAKIFFKKFIESEQLEKYLKDKRNNTCITKFGGWFIQNLTTIENDPKYHHLLIAGKSVWVITDVIAFGGSVAATVTTNGLTWPLILLTMRDLYADMNSLMHEIYPDSETMERYKKFYQDKYGISLSCLPATQIKATSAIIKGLASSGDKLRKGKLQFIVSKIGEDGFRIIPATFTEPVANQFKTEAFIDGLTPNSWYVYDLEYVCQVDGLKFTYISESQDFTTSNISVITGDAEAITENSAVVNCEYTELDDSSYEVHYYADTDGQSTEKIVYASGPGSQKVTISGLKPCTTYTYYAAIRHGGKVYEGDNKTLTTGMPDISGTWYCVSSGETYSIVLQKNGDVVYTNAHEMTPIAGSWSLSMTGKVYIGITYIATQTQNSGRTWEGQLTDMSNPVKIIGQTYKWNYNQVGYFQGSPGEFVLTR